MEESWKPVVGYEGLYEVSDQGRVKSLAKTLPHKKYGERRWPEKILKTSSNGKNSSHLKVSLWKDAKPRRHYVHRLVLEAFVGPCPKGMESLHMDDDATNNRVENLRWGTRRENIADAVRNGRNHNSAKTHCSRGHGLEEYNLVSTTFKKHGRRDCWSCHAARGFVRDNPDKGHDVQQLSDEYFAKAKDPAKRRVRHNANKTHCKRGHPLKEPNLIKGQIKKGFRACLACEQALRSIRKNPELKGREQELSDERFRKIGVRGMIQ